VRLLVMDIPRFIQLVVPLSPLKPMDQSRRGVVRILEAQVHPLVRAIPKFIQMGEPSPPLKPMAQSRCGVIMDAQAHPLIMAIDPSALRAAKALLAE
jgi:hypothetical protein